MNDDRERAEAEDRKFRAEIEELLILEGAAEQAERIYESVKPEFEKIVEHRNKCRAAKEKLRMLRRDYPGYFVQPADGSGQPAEGDQQALEFGVDIPNGETVEGIEVEIEQPADGDQQAETK